jgi:hypothetical protein
MVRILPTCVPLILLRPSIPLGPTLGKILRKLKSHMGIESKDEQTESMAQVDS